MSIRIYMACYAFLMRLITFFQENIRAHKNNQWVVKRGEISTINNCAFSEYLVFWGFLHCNMSVSRFISFLYKLHMLHDKMYCMHCCVIKYAAIGFVFYFRKLMFTAKGTNMNCSSFKISFWNFGSFCLIDIEISKNKNDELRHVRKNCSLLLSFRQQAVDINRARAE